LFATCEKLLSEAVVGGCEKWLTAGGVHEAHRTGVCDGMAQAAIRHSYSTYCFAVKVDTVYSSIL
jgi:hypothetical protein